MRQTDAVVESNAEVKGNYQRRHFWSQKGSWKQRRVPSDRSCLPFKLFKADSTSICTFGLRWWLWGIAILRYGSVEAANNTLALVSRTLLWVTPNSCYESIVELWLIAPEMLSLISAIVYTVHLLPKTKTTFPFSQSFAFLWTWKSLFSFGNSPGEFSRSWKAKTLEMKNRTIIRGSWEM